MGRQLSLVRGPERQERTVGIHGKIITVKEAARSWQDGAVIGSAVRE